MTSAGRILWAMDDDEIRAAIAAHWAASDAQDFELEHQIYAEDAVLEYPQSGERIRSSQEHSDDADPPAGRQAILGKRTVGSGRSGSPSSF